MTINKYNSIDYLSLIISFIPLLLISGPFLPDLFISISSIFFLIIAVRQRLFKYFYNLKVIFIFTFCLLIILFSLISDHIYLSLRGSLFYFRFVIFSLCIWYLLENSKKFKKLLFYSIFICLFFILIDSFIQFIFGKNILGWGLEKPYRLSSFFGEELIVGSYISRLLPIGLFLYFIQSSNKKYNGYIFLFIILTTLIVFLSGERTSFFYSILTCLVSIFFIKNFKKFRYLSIILFSSLLLICLFSNTIYDRMIVTTFNQIKSTSSSIYFFSPTHEKLWLTGMNIFYENPIKGTGPYTFRAECSNSKYSVNNPNLLYFNSCGTSPHNYYIQLLAETGIIGFSFLFFSFLFVLYLIFEHLFFSKNNSDSNIVDSHTFAIVAVFIFLWPILPNGNFFTNWTNIINFLGVGVLLFSLSSSRKKNVVS